MVGVAHFPANISGNGPFSASASIINMWGFLEDLPHSAREMVLVAAHRQWKRGQNLGPLAQEALKHAAMRTSPGGRAYMRRLRISGFRAASLSRDRPNTFG